MLIVIVFAIDGHFIINQEETILPSSVEVGDSFLAEI